ncbi:MAG: FG-GAP-like repeat-containing protein [Microcoleaceae cyanobacterium]
MRKPKFLKGRIGANLRYLKYVLIFGLVVACISWAYVKQAQTQASDAASSDFNTQIIQLDLPAVKNGLGGIIAVDVNQDQRRDFILTQEGWIGIYAHDGKKLWQKAADIQLTEKSESEGLPGLFAPGVQAADIDQDGKIELLFLDQEGTLHWLDAVSGQEEGKIRLPVPAEADKWEHLVIGNFRGQGDRDLLLQATRSRRYRTGRHLAAYAIDDLLTESQPQPLWTRDDFKPNAHNGARLADLDGDNRDEVLGETLLSPTGETLYEIPAEGHIDSIFAADVRPDIPGIEVVALEENGGNRVFLANPQGLIWETHYNNQEPQNAAIGDFDPNRPGLEIWCRSRNNRNQEPFIFDAQGQLIQRYEMKQVAPRGWTRSGVEVIFPIDWTGQPQQRLAAKERHKQGDVAIFDGISGEFLQTIPGKAARLYVADVSGDWREEIIIRQGKQLRIYSNPQPNARPQQASLWKQQYYRRGKMTWNYYSP